MLRLIFGLPPVVYFVLAALVVGAGYYVETVRKEDQAERAQALQGEMPKVTNLGEFTPSDADLAREVNIAAQFHQDHTYELHKDSRNDSNSHALYMLFDPSAKEEERIVQAAIVIPMRDDDQFYDWMIKNIDSMGAMSPVFHINGQRSGSTSYGDLARDAMRDNGFTRDDDFFYIKPFFNGRAAGLGRRSGDDMSMVLVAGVLGLILAAFGGMKMMWRRRRAG